MTNSDYFGEVSILKKCKRTATVVSKNYSTCAELNGNDLLSICSRYPTVKRCMEVRMRKHYQDKWKTFVKRTLRSIDYFSNVPDYMLEELIYTSELIDINQGSYIFKRGTP